jgi:hypothetical protein
MSTAIPNLWPEEIRVDVQTPYAILRGQANLLHDLTKGILEGDVVTETTKDDVQHRLVIVAPMYNGYRHTLIIAAHKRDFPYPTEVRAVGLGKYGMDLDEDDYPSANDDGEMQALVQKALRSGSTIAIITSLIAKSNEATGLSPRPVE